MPCGDFLHRLDEEIYDDEYYADQDPLGFENALGEPAIMPREMMTKKKFYIIFVTEKAVLLSKNKETGFWFPKSLIHFVKYSKKKKKVTVLVPDWFEPEEIKLRKMDDTPKVNIDEIDISDVPVSELLPERQKVEVDWRDAIRKKPSWEDRL